MLMSSVLPVPPSPRLSEYGNALTSQLESTKAHLIRKLSSEENERQAAFSATKQLQAEVLAASLALRNGNLGDARNALRQSWDLVDEMPSQILSPQPHRSSSVASLLEELVTAQALIDYFSTGRLLRKAELRSVVDDSEYLGGVVQFAHELAEYSVGRSMELDCRSVTLCRDVVDALNGQLMRFDFRNGPLRKKYDGLKYSLKRLEDLLYEQSLQLAPSQAGGAGVEEEEAEAVTAGGGGDSKRPRVEKERSQEEAQGLAASSSSFSSSSSPSSPSALVDEAEFTAMVQRLEAADAAREAVIKGCRDGQKLSKLAIYSIHRGEGDKARRQLREAEAKTLALKPQIDSWPTLRQGTFTNVLEEYAEAKLFEHWIATRRLLPLTSTPSGSDGSGDGGGGGSGGGGAGEGAEEGLHALLCPSKDAGAYLGGLVDLTGEIGRYAVACGTARRAQDVQQCFEATCVVSNFLAELPPTPALRKKGNAVATNLRKMGQVRYEMVLAARGRSKALVDTAASSDAPDGKSSPGNRTEDNGEAS